QIAVSDGQWEVTVICPLSLSCEACQMEEGTKYNPDALKPLEFVCEPDPRNLWFVRLDSVKGFRPIEIEEHYAVVAKYVLRKSVPREVFVQFETAKNLYLYAWYVYRFYPIAEHYAISCLEFALRTRFEDELPEKYIPRSGKPTLKHYLQYGVDYGYIRNEGFRRWHEAAEKRARTRYDMEKTEEMREKGLTSIELDYSEIEIKDEDKNFGYVTSLIKHLTSVRNDYAHGSATLDRGALRIIEPVSEIINQIYNDN
ncbi:MAG TPA: hypothetical protein VK138_13345, partial [Acidiferrobacterales bacterium]|nr:hypothetical protein [Acidiferrobacterales bacterium]